MTHTARAMGIFLALFLLMPATGHAKKRKKERAPRRSTSAESTSPDAVKSEPIRTESSSRRSGSEGDFVTEKRSDGTTIKYKKKDTYDFEGADVEGLFKKPSGSYISNIQGVKGRTIIRIRKNFDAEVVDSSRALR